MQPSQADLHIHTTFSDGMLEPEEAVKHATSRTGLRVIAVTDHNTLDGALVAREYWQHHRSDFPQIEVIVGEEVSSTAGHILGLFLHEPIPPHLSPGQTVQAIHDQGGVAIAAHPFTHLLFFSDLQGIGRRIAELPLDAVEIRNSAPTELYANWITERYNAATRKHPAVGGSDCHYLPMMGRTFTRFSGTGAEDLRRAILAGQVRAGGSVMSPAMVMRFIVDQLRKGQMPFVMPNDHHYRCASLGLCVEVEELRQSRTVVLHCTGELIRSNAHVLTAEAYRLLRQRMPHVVLNLADVTLVDYGGIKALLTVQKRAGEFGGRAALCGLSDSVAQTLQVAEVSAGLPTYTSLKRAVAAVGGGREQAEASGLRRAA